MDKKIVPNAGIPENAVMVDTFEGKKGSYEIYGFTVEGKSPQPLVETPIFKLYVAKLPTGQVGLMKINSKPETITVLKREFRVLQSLQQISEQLDTEALERGDQSPQHGVMFPLVLEALEPDEQRFVMFLGYHPIVQTYRQMKPLSFLTHSARVDLKTAAWILGKLLKTLAFVHALNFLVGRLDASNIMLETELHGTFLLDFSGSDDEPTEDDKLNDVKAFAKTIWYAAGGDEEVLPNHDVELMTEEDHTIFCDFLTELMNQGMDASKAHKELYKLIDAIWPRKRKLDDDGNSFLKRDFHEWVTYKRKRS